MRNRAIVLLVAVVGFFAVSFSVLATVPEVYLSTTKLQQADTLLIRIPAKSPQPTGTLGGIPLRFYKSPDQRFWLALPGVAVNKDPGTYALRIFVNGLQVFKKNIVVQRRNFPVTSLIVTAKLAQQGYTPKKIISTIQTKENVELNRVLSVINPLQYAPGPFSYPLAYMQVVGAYGDIRKSGSSAIQHLGADLKAPMGTPVMAVNNGQVVFEESLPDYGNTLVVDHGLGVYSLYLHLSEFKAAVGDMVLQGQVIGLSGDTGYVLAPHLHFSIKMRGASIDPLKFIATSQIP